MKREPAKKKTGIKTAVKKISGRVKDDIKRKSTKIKAAAKKLKDAPDYGESWSSAYTPMSDV